MFIVITAILYFLSALGSEIYVGVTEALALHASRRSKKSSVLASGSNTLEEGMGNIEAEVNPMFLADDGTSAKLGANKDSLVASILAQKESPPLQLWVVFRNEFASLVDRLKESQLKAAEGSAAVQKLAAMADTSRDKTSIKRERSELAAAPVKRVVGGALGGASPSDAPSPEPSSLSSAAGAGRRGVMSSLRDAYKSPLSAMPSPAASTGLRLQTVGGGPEESEAVSGVNPLLSGKKSTAAGAAAAAAGAEGAAAPEAGKASASAYAPDPEYPGLPPGWLHRLTSKGKVLFYNEETHESAYKLEKIPGYPYTPAAGAATAAAPTATASAPAPAAGGQEGEGEEEDLPPGWASRLTSKGKKMYFHEDGRTTWSRAKIPTD